MNGTGAATLLEDYRNAMAAVRDASEAISKIEFNARDYYPVEGSWDKAVKEMRARREALEKIHDDFLAIAIHVMEHAKPA